LRGGEQAGFQRPWGHVFDFFDPFCCTPHGSRNERSTCPPGERALSHWLIHMVIARPLVKTGDPVDISRQEMKREQRDHVLFDAQKSVIVDKYEIKSEDCKKIDKRTHSQREKCD
jgi:hypothetical protein